MSRSTKPSLRFFYSDTLHARILQFLDALEQAEDPTKHANSLGDLVVELTDTGMDYYFLKPLELAGVGFVLRQSASLGTAGAVKVIGSVTRKIIGRLDGPQLLSIGAYLRKLMH